jgi:hypothetical protein
MLYLVSPSFCEKKKSSTESALVWTLNFNRQSLCLSKYSRYRRRLNSGSWEDIHADNPSGMCSVYCRPTQFGTSGLTAEGVKSVGASGGALTDGQLASSAWEQRPDRQWRDGERRPSGHHSLRTCARTLRLYASLTHL